MSKEWEQIRETNRRVWNHRAREGMSYVDTAKPSDFSKALDILDPHHWMRDLSFEKLNVLCLAAGGGRHGPLFASLGARVTVMDLSPEMLALDYKIAQEKGYPIRLVEGSMEDLSPLAEESFDLVVQPVSTCYVADPRPVFHQIARVLRPGHLYISYHKQPISQQCDSGLRIGSRHLYPIQTAYFHTNPLPQASHHAAYRESQAIEYLHTWETLLGELCRSGFVLEDLREPRHGKPDASPGTFAHRSYYIPPFVSVKARRTEKSAQTTTLLWTP